MLEFTQLHVSGLMSRLRGAALSGLVKIAAKTFAGPPRGAKHSCCVWSRALCRPSWNW